ncbi:12S rRNA N4-methylcytidine (m4C) methyltransferase isoform X2 [Rattus norvegicus]|uniref:12S rRNA N4-methylcytidine (m4C) methyltransferase isoform c n=1 Tax=Rattus norvegicus TaxID=10116 RepID=UPI002FD7A9EE
MLRYPYFCRTYNRLFSYFVDSGAFNLDVCPHTIHTTAAMHTEYKASEGIALCDTQKVYRSEETDSEAMAKLHIPVMVDEVVQCLTPQKGQVFLDMTFGSGGHSKAILQKEPDVTVYALDRDPVAFTLAERLSEMYPGSCNLRSATSLHPPCESQDQAQLTGLGATALPTEQSCQLDDSCS